MKVHDELLRIFSIKVCHPLSILLTMSGIRTVTLQQLSEWMSDKQAAAPDVAGSQGHSDAASGWRGAGNGACEGGAAAALPVRRHSRPAAGRGAAAR